MGADFLKDAYYGLEEKYYSVLDKIDKVIPIYKVIDQIDKVIPSFAIFLCIIIFLLIVGAWFLLGLVLVKPTVGITLQAQTNEGDLLPNALVKFPALNLQFVTNSEGLTPKTQFEKDSKVKYEVSKKGFEIKKGEFTADSARLVEIVLVEQAAASLNKTVIIKDSLGRLILKPAHFAFSCIGPGTPEPKDITVSNGSVRVLMPSSCKTLIANVDVAGFQSRQSVSITESTQEIQLQELESELSTIKARVAFNNEPVPGIIVGLYEFSLGPLEEKTTDSAGLAEFKTPASTYQLKTKPTSDYGQKITEEFTTSAGQVIEKKIELKKDISALLSVNVLEKNTSKKISGALVTVKKENNVVDRKTTDSNGSVSFNLNALGAYSISADHSNYLIGEKTINIPNVGNFTESIILEKYTGDNAATLKVKVLDAETQKGVKSARVALYYGQSEEKEGFLAPYTEQLTDLNGIARFARVKPGTYYYAVAAKQGAFGRSDSQRFDLRNADSFYLNVSLVIPHGTVKVIARDNDGNPVSNAKVSLFDAFDNSLIGSELTDGNGVWVLPAQSNFAKADKEVYIRVEKTALNPDEKDFMPYTTVSKPILPNTVQAFNVIMQEKILGGNFKLVALGLFKKDKQAGSINPAATPNLSAGQQYIARFRIEIPVEKTYTGAIVHVHGGKGDFGYGIMEKDSIVLKAVNMPLSTNVLKATSLDKSNGFENDSATATSGDAKWANIPIPALSPGIYELEALLEVKSNALVGEQIGIYSWMAGTIDGEEKFFPPMEAMPQDDFYLEPPQKQLFQVGVATLCDSEFCFNASIKEAIPGGLGESVEESYNAKILGNYKLIFNISNNSQTTVHNDAQLRVKNNDSVLSFKEYSITLPSGRTVSGTNSKSELPNIDITNSQNQNRFEKGAVIFGEVLFTPQKSTNSILSFKIASSSDPQHTGLYSIVFQKDLAIIVSASNEFSIEVSPEELAAGIENSIEVLVKDKKTGLEVENAAVTAKDRFGNSLATGFTSRLGKASLRIPELLPGEEITLEISKPDYNLKEAKLKASAVLLSAKPETISIAINSTLEKEKTAELVLENVSAITLKITGLEFSGNSLNLLDDTAVNNALAEQAGFELQPGEKKTVKFTAFLTQEGMNIKQRQQTEGTLIVRAGNSGSVWSLEVPVKAVIGFGAELDLQDCLQAMPKVWVTATQGKSISYSFKIQNNCSSNGMPIALTNLEAKVLWGGNEIGSFLLALHASKTSGAISAAELRAGYFKKLLERFEPETSFDALLTFTPYGGINGLANAKIIIQARNKAENSKEDQVLVQELAVQISAVNLQECISFSKDMLSIAKDPKLPESMTDFAIINKKDCGTIKVLLSSMPSDSLNISKTEITIPDGMVSEPIIVSAGKNAYPGQYSILVKAQLQGQATASDITSIIEKDKTLRVRVFDPGLCLQLDKYEFNMWDDPSIADDGFDNAELTNYCYEKPVKFKVDMQDLQDSLGSGLRNGAMQSMLPVLLAALNELLRSLMGARGGGQAAQQAAAQAAGAQAALQGINQSIEDTKTAQRAVDEEITAGCDAFNPTQALYYETSPEQGMGCSAAIPAGNLQGLKAEKIAEFSTSKTPEKILFTDEPANQMYYVSTGNVKGVAAVQEFQGAYPVINGNFYDPNTNEVFEITTTRPIFESPEYTIKNWTESGTLVTLKTTNVPTYFTQSAEGTSLTGYQVFTAGEEFTVGSKKYWVNDDASKLYDITSPSNTTPSPSIDLTKLADGARVSAIGTQAGAGQPTTVIPPAPSSSEAGAGKEIIETQKAEAKAWVEEKIAKDVSIYCNTVECTDTTKATCVPVCIAKTTTQENTQHLKELETNFKLISDNCLSDSEASKPISRTSEAVGATAAPKEEAKDAIFFIAGGSAATLAGASPTASAGSGSGSYFKQAVARTEQAAKCFAALTQTAGEKPKGAIASIASSITSAIASPFKALAQKVGLMNAPAQTFGGLFGVTGLKAATPPTTAEVKAILDPIAKEELAQLNKKLASLEAKIEAANIKVQAITPAATRAINAKTTALGTQSSALTPVSQFARPAYPLMQTAISNTKSALKPENEIAGKASALSKVLAKSKTSVSNETKKTGEKGKYQNNTEELDYDKVAEGLTDDTKKALEKEKENIAESTHKNLDTGKGASAAATSGTILGIASTAKEMLTAAVQALNNALIKTGIARQDAKASPRQQSATTSTGFAILPEPNYGGGLYGGFGSSSPYGGIPNYGGGYGGGFDPLSALTSIGSSLYGGGMFGGNPLTQGLGTFMGNTLYDVGSRDITGLTAIKPDIEITGIEVFPVKIQAGTGPDSEISVEAVGNPVTDNRIDSTLMNESIGLSFKNESPGNKGTFYKLLKVSAIRHYYKEDKVYKLGELNNDRVNRVLEGRNPFNTSPLEAGRLLREQARQEEGIDEGEVGIEERNDSPKEASQYFLLQFNEIDPTTMGATDTLPPINLDCISYAPPGLHGNTGPEAAPKVLLDWSWNSIKSDSCDDENPNFVFCDGVQFSMEVLRKIQLIREFLAANKLTCPSAVEAIGTKENTIESDDIGISRLYTDVTARTGVSDINVIVTVENKAPVNLNTKLTVTVTNPATGSSLPACIKQLNVVSKSTVGCEFSGLMQDNTAYTVVAGIQPDLSNCSVTNCNSDTTNDIENSSFLVTEKPLLQECEPYKTSRLKDFIDATENELQGETLTYPQGLSKEEFLKSVHFNAYLIQDRYSPDLQSDFDNYYRNIAFAQTPAWYKGSGDDPGLGVIFKDFKNFRIAPKFGEAPEIGYLLPTPGLYEGTIDIEFGNENWQFFANRQADVKVFVKLQKSPTQPASLSPFYYLPFDGLVGTVDSQGGRTRYGLNYEGEALNITAGPDVLRTVGGASWSAFSDAGILEAGFENNFKTLNVESRGQILSVKKDKLVFSPSFATPAILKVENNNGEACASYNLGLESTELTLIMESNPWWGIGEQCKDFDNSLMIEKWQNGLMDKSNATTGSWQTQCGNAQSTVYGIEWPGTQMNFGKVFLKTIFYTPQKMQNSVNVVMQDDDAEIITPNGSGKTNIPLTGVGASAENLQAVSEILELVKQRQVCVSGEALEQTFWWNPTPVMNALADAELSAEQECIK